ncbi:HigA family addiction module antidote protein [Duganella sp. sic0402]|uniref:HigA family addiction module antitoxin n=1 Tax=Duganella sp. sic0402 TaxID=2854786 RepID=UPI001C45F67E|nr:HigA family addiction module antitoxin [Duganella sp. sic0402]MBV7538334.1 HigA family addiction module antidote protein [Duganella sp. sic0402]
MPEDKMRPIHPGEILREDFLVPLKMTPVVFAGMLDLSEAVITEIVNERRAVCADVAARIVRRFGGDVAFWLSLQLCYDEKVALTSGQHGPARRAVSS